MLEADASYTSRANGLSLARCKGAQRNVERHDFDLELTVPYRVPQGTTAMSYRFGMPNEVLKNTGSGT